MLASSREGVGGVHQKGYLRSELFLEALASLGTLQELLTNRDCEMECGRKTTPLTAQGSLGAGLGVCGRNQEEGKARPPSAGSVPRSAWG